MNKRGQFFLVAAVVIIAVLIGLATVYSNIEIPKEDSAIYDLSKEMNYEAGAVIDSGMFNSISDGERSMNIENLTDYYAKVNPGTDLLFVYGDRDGMAALFYTTEDIGSVGLGIGGTGSVDHQTEARRFNTTFDPGNDETVTIMLSEEVEHTFAIKPGQTFFVLLQKERQGERYVSASD